MIKVSVKKNKEKQQELTEVEIGSYYIGNSGIVILALSDWNESCFKGVAIKGGDTYATGEVRTDWIMSHFKKVTNSIIKIKIT